MTPLLHTCSVGFRDCGEVLNELVGAKVVADEDDRVDLCLWRIDPLYARPQHARVTIISSKSHATVATHFEEE